MLKSHLHAFVDDAELLRHSPRRSQTACAGGSFGPEEDDAFLWGTTAVCLITLHQDEARSQSLDPSSVTWRPDAAYAQGDLNVWPPALFTEASGVRPVLLYLRGPGERRWLHAGPAHVGMWMTPPPERWSEREALFRLQEPLPRDIWRRFGPGGDWRVTVGHGRGLVFDADQEEQLVATIEAASAQSSNFHLHLQRYEDEAWVFFNEARGLIELRVDEEPALACDPLGDDGEEHFTCACGIDIPISRRDTLPRAETLRRIRRYFAKGVSPLKD